jgi:hypothetical protein
MTRKKILCALRPKQVTFAHMCEATDSTALAIILGSRSQLDDVVRRMNQILFGPEISFSGQN